MCCNWSNSEIIKIIFLVSRDFGKKKQRTKLFQWRCHLLIIKKTMKQQRKGKERGTKCVSTQDKKGGAKIVEERKSVDMVSKDHVVVNVADRKSVSTQ